MQFQQITPHHEYNGSCIGLMNLDVPNLPETLQVEGYTLLRKPEFHITLLCPKNIAPLINPNDFEGTKAQITAFFVDFASKNNLTTYTLRPEFRLVKQGQDVTVVVMAEMPGLVKLFDALETEFNITLPLQPAHITIYSLQYNMGIGINSPQELQQLSHVINVPLTI